ncbi:hypothetical protein FRB94_008949 [Tulasnella sp. JGI-2019a]|nr:hypothetical protein FRB94_008949 [Tulasnella sp. JGI-2019a]
MTRLFMLVVGTTSLFAYQKISCQKRLPPAKDIPSKRLSHLLNTPVQVLSQVRLQDTRLERSKSRVGREPCVGVHESFCHDVVLFPTVLALRGIAVNERIMRYNVGTARSPLVWVFGEDPDEEDHREAATKLNFFV